MFIKYPDSDNALRSLCGMIVFVKDMFSNCVRQRHDVVAISYISSPIISPRVAHKGNQLLDEIHNLVNLSPNFICGTP